jgi:TrmH family RNA methyltransferase
MRIIDSPQNPYIKHLVKLSLDNSYRNAQKQVVLEGKKLIQDILPLVSSAMLLSTNETSALPHVETVQISSSVARALTQTESPEEIFAVVPLPDIHFPDQLTHLLVLDGVSDPGNLGTLLRTALALGWQGVFFLPGCADPFNSKALRAAQGALFHLPYKKGKWADLAPLQKQYGLLPIAADLEGVLPEKISSRTLLLVLGSEGQGLSAETRAHCEKVTIPLSGRMESLNVAAAGAILMYALRSS